MPVGDYKLGSIVLRIRPGTYTGYGYEDQAAVTKLLGMDPARADKNEVVQSSAKGARSCSFSAYADNATDRDALVATLYTQTTHEEGDGSSAHNVIVVKAQAKVWAWFGNNPHWLVDIVLRER